MEDLAHLKALIEREDLRQLEHHLARLLRERKTNDIARLFLLFDDAVDDDDIMFSIIHTVETLDHESYMAAFLDHIESVFSSAPGWAGVLLVRIVNHASALKALKVQLKANPDKTAIISRVTEQALEIKKDMPVL